MLSANLLPEKEKKEIRREEWRRLMMFCGKGVVAVLGLGLVLLTPSYLPIFFQRNELEHARVLEEEATRSLGVADTWTRVDNLGGAVREVLQASKRPQQMAHVFDTLVRDARGISVVSFSVEGGGLFTLEGYAATRADLLGFERELRESGCMKDIVFPLANIIKEADIKFTMRGTLTEPCGL